MTVDFLQEKGIAAVPYHGKMDGDTRSRNQERWMTDEVRVLVGTIAFGLGHQQARGARGDPPLAAEIARALLPGGRTRRTRRLARRLRVALAEERRWAARLLHRADHGSRREAARVGALPDHPRVRGVEHCRHKQICEHFGEKKVWENCGACDVCGTKLEWMGKAVEREHELRPVPDAKPRKKLQDASWATGRTKNCSPTSACGARMRPSAAAFRRTS